MQKSKAIIVGVALLCLAGCGGGIVGQQQPRVRLFNAADGQATVFAAYQDSNLVNLGMSPNASFGSATTDTIISNTTATASIDTPSGTLVTTSPNLFRVGSFYTVHAYGKAGSGYHGMIVEDSQAVANGGSIGIRAIQLGANNPSVDITVSQAASQTIGGPLFTNVGQGTVSGSGNTSSAVDANGYVLFATNSSTLFAVSVTAHGSTTAIATTTFTLVPGSYYTIVVLDSSTSGSQTTVSVLSDRRA